MGGVVVFMFGGVFSVLLLLLFFIIVTLILSNTFFTNHATDLGGLKHTHTRRTDNTNNRNPRLHNNPHILGNSF